MSNEGYPHRPDEREPEDAFLARMKRFETVAGDVARYVRLDVKDFQRLIGMAERQRPLRLVQQEEVALKDRMWMPFMPVDDGKETHVIRRVSVVAHRSREFPRQLESRTYISEDLLNDISDEELAKMFGELFVRACRTEMHRERQKAACPKPKLP